jgi:hypothetical protein
MGLVLGMLHRIMDFMICVMSHLLKTPTVDFQQWFGQLNPRRIVNCALQGD